MEHRKEISIPLSKLTCGVEKRVNNDISVLLANIKNNDQIEPLLVEGPDSRGKYYIIKGYRRYLSIKKLGYKTALCRVIGPLTSWENRNKIRSEIFETTKKPTGVDKKFVWEAANGKTKDLPEHKRKKYARSIQVPKEKREAIAKVRGSQEALEVIWLDLDCSVDLRDELYQRLLDGRKLGDRKIACEHAIALKKLVRHKEYDHLDDNQKAFAIEATLSKGKFSNADVELIIVQALLQKNPKTDFFSFWMKYVAAQLEYLAGTIPDNPPKIDNNIMEDVSKAYKFLLKKLNPMFNQSTHDFNDYTKDYKAAEDMPETNVPENSQDYGVQMDISKSKGALVPYITQEGHIIRVIFPRN